MASCNDDFSAIEPLTPQPGETKPKPPPAVKRMRASIVVGHAASTLVFDGSTRVGIDRRAVFATLERRMSSQWTLQAAAGGIAIGSLKLNGETYSFGPGWSAGLSASYRALDGRGAKPFLLLGATLAFAGARTQASAVGAPLVGYLAGDLRLSVVVGKTFFQALSPYALVRGFGGPIWWQINGKDVLGTDAYKFQIGAGLAVTLPKGLDVFIEGVPLGEKALSTGLGYSF